MKTSLTFGFQPVTVDELLQYMLRIVLVKARPLLKGVMPKEALIDQRGFMLPEWSTEMEIIKRDPIKTFCRKYIGTTTTTTDVRAMWEMLSGYLADKRKTKTSVYILFFYPSISLIEYLELISTEQRNSIMTGSGHGGHTVKKNYMISQRKIDAKAILDVSAVAHEIQPVSSKMLSASSSQSTAQENPSRLTSLSNDSAAPYLKQPVVSSGLASIGEWHPDKRDAVTEGRPIRVMFSALELGYIGEFSRNREDLFAENRIFKEAVGDYKVARY
jgi:hypothetical protein